MKNGVTRIYYSLLIWRNMHLGLSKQINKRLQNFKGLALQIQADRQA